eukprot:jgi/Galph1/1201/GphlegSOOS_G5929.1
MFQRYSYCSETKLSLKEHTNFRDSTKSPLSNQTKEASDGSVLTGWQMLPQETQQRILNCNNKIEKLKAEKDGSLAWREIETYGQMLRNGNIKLEDIPPEDVDIRFKWAGFFHRRKRAPGTFMIRLRLPNGIIWSHQLKGLCQFLRRYDLQQTCFDITTRQNLQLRGVRLEDSSVFLEELKRLGIGCFQSGMDNVRNIVGSCLAGVDSHETYDTRQLCFDLDDMIAKRGRGKPEYTNLPRKFNIAIGSSSFDTVHAHINDLAFLPVNQVGSRKLLFKILVGGLLSPKTNETSRDLGIRVPESSILVVTHIILEIYRDFGLRSSRATSRFIFLIEAWGLEKMRAEITRKLNEANAEWYEPDDGSMENFSKQPHWASDIFGVHPQKQENKVFLGCKVPVGRMSVEETETLADIAERYSNGEIRLTVDQNFILPNIDIKNIDDVLKETLLQEKFSYQPQPLSKGLVSCTGAQFCGLALIETKNRALKICKALEEHLEFPIERPVRIHWTGCPNSCGQAQVADIGLMGAPAKHDGKLVEGVDIYINGTAGTDSKLGTLYRKGVSCDTELLPTMMELLQAHFGAKLKIPVEKASAMIFDKISLLLAENRLILLVEGLELASLM